MTSVTAAGLNAQVDALSDDDEGIFDSEGKVSIKQAMWLRSGCGRRTVGLSRTRRIKNLYCCCASMTTFLPAALSTYNKKQTRSI